METFACGGAVRDEILGGTPKDYDYVVVGSTPEEMLKLGYKCVGNDFPVFLHPKTGDEYALARTERKTGDKHTDFEFEFGPHVTLEMDSLRRDFTMNAIYKDDNGEYIDLHNGIKDIEDKIIRHVDSNYFIQDPLRVLRAIQFKCRFGFTIAPETMKLCKQMVKDGMLDHLTPERIWNEIEKGLHTPRFYDFIETLDEMGALQVIFPEVAALKYVPENVVYHPEKNTYNHLLLTLQQVFYCFFEFPTLVEEQDPHEIALVNFGLLCHDLGKQLTDTEKWPSHHGHDNLGIGLIKTLCDRLKVPNEYRDYAILASRYHMKYYEFMKSHVKTQFDFVHDVTDNFRYFERLAFLHRIHHCDLCGRSGKIAPERLENYWIVTKRMNTIFSILKDITLKDLPKDTQIRLSNYKGEKFGKLYRDAKISYLKHKLSEVK